MDDQGQPRLHISYPKYKEGEATVREVRVAPNYGESLIRTIVAKYTSILKIEYLHVQVYINRFPGIIMTADRLAAVRKYSAI